MSNPHAPGDPDPQPLRQGGGDDEQARAVVLKVIDAYNTRLVSARRDPARHAPGLVADWRQARDQAVDELDRLDTATPDETVQIALSYAARLKELQGS